MEDIEDLLPPIQEDVPRLSTGVVTVKNFKQPEAVEKSDSGVFLPGQATVFVKTWGCGHNNSDGEYMAGMLADNGYGVVLDHEKANSADVWVLNSCTVKGPSQQTFENDIEKGLIAGKKVIVAGCVPQGNQTGKHWQNLSVIGVQQIDKVVHVVEETLKGNTVRLLKESKEKDETGRKRKTGGASLDLPKIRRNPYIEIIPINTGCLNQCTYCKTKHARGDLGSYHPEEIIDRVKTVLNEGVLEIWLTSEDTGAYGRDIGVSIVDLLWGIVKAIEEHPTSVAMLRVGMTNPPYILEHLEEIAKVLAHPRVYSFLHVPVQAGATEVLNDMARLYVIEDFERVCDVLLSRIPQMTLATDIICGFPTESEVHFDETMRILEKYKFSVLHISQFYPRPGTPAARLKRLPTHIVKERSRRATKFFNSYTSYDHYLGNIEEVLVTEISADGHHFVAHNKNYIQILIEKDDRLMGKKVKVEITSTSKWHLKGRVLDSCFEEIDNGTVQINKIPKLVRKQRKVKALENGESLEQGDREDGAVLSTKKVNVEQHMENSNWINYGAAALVVPLMLAPIRKSFKVALLVAGAILYQSSQ